MRLLAVLLFALGVLAQPARAQETEGPRGAAEAAPSETAAVPMDDPQALLEEATNLFNRGVEAHEREPETARAYFEQAAVHYHALVERHGIENHRLLVNLGNAAMLAGDQGRAVLAYRRAAELRPTSERVQRSLQYARRRVGVSTSPTVRERLSEALLAWRGLVPRGGLFGVALAAYVALWALALVRLGGVRWTRRPALALAAVLAATLGLLAIDHASRAGTEHAVVTQAGGAEARDGPDDGVYESTFGRPVPPGAEVRVLERRSGWARIRLMGGLETWVREDAIERV